MEARVERIETGVADHNAWVIGDDEEVIVVDPGEYSAPVLDAVGDRVILAVICTHGHAAQTGAAPAVAERDEAPVALHPRDRLTWREAHGDEMPEIEMEQDGAFEVSDVTLDVLHTPGHTPGHCAFALEDRGVIFSGDALVTRDNVSGRTGPQPIRWNDDQEQARASYERLFALPADVVLPGHGEPWRR